VCAATKAIRELPEFKVLLGIRVIKELKES